MEDRLVVPELEVLDGDRLSLPLLGEDLRRFEHLFDEHRALSLRGGREEVEVLPERSPYRARNPDEVMEPPEPPLDRVHDQVGIRVHARPRGHAAIAVVFDASHLALDHEAAEAPVRDEDVRAAPEQEMGNFEIPGTLNGRAKLVRGGRSDEEVRGSPDAERRKGRERDVALDAETA
jgi:hypothetical protein